MSQNKEKLFEAFRKVRDAAALLSYSAISERNLALKAVAKALDENHAEITKENLKDIEAAALNGTSEVLLHRLKLSDDKMASLAAGLTELQKLPDPVGRTSEKRELDSGFILEKRTFPIGVIGMIFESRPDALVQIAALALKSGNGIILKGGREAVNTNRKLVSVIKKATSGFSFGSGWILGIESHEDVDILLNSEAYVDLLIPRGSNEFVRHVMENTRIPVIGHSGGICATYVESYEDIGKALKVCIDAKVQYPAACNATETFLINKNIADAFLPELNRVLRENNVKVHADEQALKLMPGSVPAKEEDFYTEYLGLECSIKVVSSVQEAIKHIQNHGSHHTDAILTLNMENAALFVAKVDSADVFVNCSTRFADGFRFGLGAEVGISTSKLHARGPVGLDGLMTTKWVLTGNGQTVAEYSGPKGKPFRHRELDI